MNKTTILLLASLLFFGSGLSAQEWEPLGPQPIGDDAHIGSRVVTSNGRIYAAYQSLTQRKALAVFEFSDGVWSEVGDLGFLPPVGEFSNLVAQDDELWLAVNQDTATRPLSVLHYDGAEWNYVGDNPINGDQTASPNLAIRQGEPFLLYREASSDQLKSVAFTGGTWQQVGDLSEIVSSGWNPDLIVAEDGTAYASFRRFLGPLRNELAVAVLNGQEWSLLGDAAVTPLAQNSDDTNPQIFSDLALDSTGVVYLSYSVSDTIDFSFDLLTTRRFVKGGWETLGNTVDDIVGLNRKSVHLVFFRGRPTVAYTAFSTLDAPNATEFGVSVIILDDDQQWVKLPGTDPFAGVANVTSIAQYNWFAASEDGQDLYISYAPNWPTNGRLNVLRYRPEEDPTSTDDPSENLPVVHLWPNPTDQFIFLDRAVHYRVLDTGGRSLSQGFGHTVDLGKLPIGMYVLRLEVASGKWTDHKVVRQ